MNTGRFIAPVRKRSGKVHFDILRKSCSPILSFNNGIFAERYAAETGTA